MAHNDGHKLEDGPISLMRAIYGSEREENEDFDYIHDYDRLEVARLIDEVLDTLSERERLVIKERFGLNPGDTTPKTLEQVARSLRAGTPFGKDGVTRERIRQIQMIALRKLRHSRRRLPMEEQLNPHLVRKGDKSPQVPAVGSESCREPGEVPARFINVLPMEVLQALIDEMEEREL